MKLFTLAIVFALIQISPSFAGQVVYKNMYSQANLVQGSGHDEVAALRDARSSIPEGYAADPGNSPEIQCLDLKGEIAPVSLCIHSASPVLATIPVLKVQ